MAPNKRLSRDIWTKTRGGLADLDLHRLEVVRRVPANQQTEGAALNLPAAVVMAKGIPKKA